VRRVLEAGRRDVVLHRDDGTSLVPPIDLTWTYATRGELTAARHHRPEVLRRKANFLCGHLDDVALHALEPLTGAMPEAVSTYVPGPSGTVSAAHALLDMLVRSVAARQEELGPLYERCAAALTSLPDASAAAGGLALLLDRMAVRPAGSDVLTEAVISLVVSLTATDVGVLSPALDRWAAGLRGAGMGEHAVTLQRTESGWRVTRHGRPAGGA